MAIAFSSEKLTFNASKGGEQKLNGKAIFDRKVVSADAALKAFSIGFTEGDHEFYREMIIIDHVINVGTAVTFEVEFALRDSSGRWDDLYDGSVTVLVIADLEEREGD